MKMKNKIETWNVHILYTAGKFANAVKEIKRLQVDILDISETRWANSGSYNGITFYYLGIN
jgi:hypothetical protein